ncbi:Bug family protein [Brachybacterium sp. P6-10-X1]|uniref:tripartite tricarboxylate transporter substrate binding protein n=1 Tax=Brachybacterium sp. P6-10-X1 TaxID=1903186 RepID=UPI000971887E|nr:tripartite tricarboxylate transporter substrate binding protein [Brachybacterium sp. P6-10-X1]APX33990.1 Bug family protein [Brachybacterium sp. P6-10-X1]
MSSTPRISRRALAAPALGLTATLLFSGCANVGGGSGGSGGSSDSGGGASVDYPTGPITLVVGFSAGGSTDTGARLMATALEEKLGTSFTVVNKPGANSQLAYTELTQSEPDGYTMSTINFPSAIMTVIDESRGATYTREDFAPVALQVIDPTAIAVAPDSDIETPEDLIAAAEAAPGELRATTTGVASNEHFALAMLEKATGAKIAPVHFADGASAATTAFLGGNTELLLANISDLQSLQESGELRIIGVMDEERSDFVPDVPTFAEAGIDVSLSSSRGYAFPAGTPDEVITTVSDAMGEVMATPEFEEKMTQQGLAPAYKDSEEYAEYWTETQALFEELYPLVREAK